MAKYKPCNEDQMVMLPISLPNQLVPGTLEHTISELVDKHMDLSVFDARFSNTLLVCEEMGLLGGTHFGLDGVKLSANVSKEWSGTFDELKRKRDKLEEKVQRLLAAPAQAEQAPAVEL